MKLIVGLGNPGEKYQDTRHNLGFMAVNRFLKDFESVKDSVWKKNTKLKSDIVELDWQPKAGSMEKIILALPQTYMNNSGLSVSLIANYYKIAPSDIWIIHDELDLPIGSMRIRFGGAAAGHHGIESIIESLATDKFWRFRLGIGLSHPHSGQRIRDDVADPKFSRQFIGSAEKYVLSNFTPEDHSKARELIKHASEAISYALEKSLEKSMNRFNTK